MPKNKGKGGKNRRRGKNENEGAKRELILKEDGQEYAQVRSFSKVGLGILST
jgi:translation initiation factor 1A